MNCDTAMDVSFDTFSLGFRMRLSYGLFLVTIAS